MPHSLRRAYAWIGAGLFVASLLYFLYFYLIALDRPRQTRGGLTALTVDVLLFSIFALHHSIMARMDAKQWLTRFVPAELERSTYVWIASLLFFATCAWWQRIDGVLYDVGGIIGIALRLVQAAGIVLALTASAALEPFELAGLRPAGTAATAEADEPHASRAPEPSLRTTGVYGWVRHPVYFGWVLFVFGTPRMTTDRLVFATISTAYLAMAVPFEERSLVEAFGDRYRMYASRVRWKILPGIY
ncbi:MAG TPA: isoprenylcysteine carboxylmethyltransferase family protein [Vicinamibacterales bacterium]|jgi:protein-S-isoprenylcysteine O-methyltransferase Ste14|nr:isoprenylcysteine carboxylmethyltransferase family protein [Vicinamibacterales bacterium]